MGSGVVAFLLGVLAFQQLGSLPAPGWALLLIPALWALWRLPRPWHLIPACAAGLLWALVYGHWLLDDALAPALEGHDLTVIGTVTDLPERRPRTTRFLFDIQRVTAGAAPGQVPARVRLSWYGEAPALVPGARWRLQVRLKRPNGYSNPGGLDYEAWLFRHRIRATGYVRHAVAAQRLPPAPARPGEALARARQRLAGELDAALDGAPHAGILKALAIGVRSGISEADWDTLRRTGTGHLVAISGLHIGLLAGLVFFAVRRLWAALPGLVLRVPAPVAAAWAGLLAGLGYAALAGFSLPTQRALIMIALVMAAVVLRRAPRAGHALASAALGVLILDPLAVLAPGFWLSFGAVAVILYAQAGRLGRGNAWWRWGRVQWAVALGLLPLLLTLFQAASLVSPLANLVAVPVVSLLVIPPVLAGTALLPWVPGLAAAALHAAAWLLAVLWHLLAGLAALPWAQWTGPAPDSAALVLATAGMALLLAPRGLPGRWLGLCMLLPAAVPQPLRPAPGEAWFTLLDVGQGLSAVVRTAHHTLVYDTGPRFPSGFNAGDAVVVPFLRHAGVGHLDLLLVSHGDMDHRGGAPAVRAAYPAPVLTSAPRRLRAPTRRCHAGLQWRWDGVRFRVLHPRGAAARGNNRSCVLRVDAGADSVLLPGDIEAGAERALLARGAPLRADILVAPHHGSTTSSTPAFVAAVAPQAVVFPVGYRNRYGFPKPSILARYAAQGVERFDSARDGAITYRLGGAPGLDPPERFRRASHRYWNR